MSRPPSPSLPKCPNPTHDGSRVSRDGSYDKRKRQRFRCTLPSGEFHRFVPLLPRHQVENGVCTTCDNPVHTHQGPIAMLGGYYEVREIAAALIDVAKGMSYTEAARRVRMNYWGRNGTGRLKANSVENGQSVSDWLNQFGPTISERHAEDEWPETIILDSTEYKYLDPRTGVMSQLFVVLAAWGYEAGSTRGRLWRVEARPNDKTADWVAFLEALPGTPQSVVYDGERSIRTASRQHFGNLVPTHICEHHLYKNALKALAVDEAKGLDGPPRALLNDAFHGPKEWQAFRKAAQQSGCTSLIKWVTYWDQIITTQTGLRRILPAHYSTGPLDRAIDTIRQATESRKWTFRNRERMNQLLDLIRLHINRRDTPEGWAELIRQHLETNGGKPLRARQLADTVRYNAAGNRVYSLRA